MGLPSEDQRMPAGSATSDGNTATSFYDGDQPTYAEPSALSNGESTASHLPLAHRPQDHLDASRPPPPRRDTGESGGTLTPEPGQTPRERTREKSRRPSGQRICGKCQRHLTGQFVRALGDTYHLECFTCHDCDKIVASKFFPVPDQPPNQYPLCETDYFRRLDLLCFACGGALRGSYITALDRKYHIEHFTCSVCPTVFGASDSYYEHEGSVYCHYHYSTRFAQKCNGCGTAILKQFVEIFRNGGVQHWHPECYMIHKYWNVRLHAPTPNKPPLHEAEDRETEAKRAEEDMEASEASEELRRVVRTEEEKVEGKVHWIWQTLSTFEEKSATCISDMLLHVSNGAYMDGVVAAKKFITHVDLLFAAADDLDRRLQNRPNAPGGPKPAEGGGRGAGGVVRTFDTIVHPGLSYSREAKLLCKKVVAFFQLLAESQETGVRRLGVTQELLSLVTGLAHYLKLMIRICLSGALKLERETASAEGLEAFLRDISRLDDILEGEGLKDNQLAINGLGGALLVVGEQGYVDKSADTCAVCAKAVEDKCFRRRSSSGHEAEGKEPGSPSAAWSSWVLHTQCLSCNKCGRDLSADPEGLAKWTEESDDEGFGRGMVWCEAHAPRAAQAGGFTSVSRLQQYVHLLRVAHARLLATLRTSGALPHTSDDPNLAGYDSREGHTPKSSEGGDPPGLLRSNTRSRSYAGRSSGSVRRREEGARYEDTMGDIRRLRSTRMDKMVSNAGKNVRKSRIIDGPEGMRPSSSDGAETGSAGGSGAAGGASSMQQKRRTGTFQIVEDKDATGAPITQLTFGRQDTMTLDDIPRIVQAQQTREQRPNASKFARQPMIPQEPRPRLVNGGSRHSHGPNDFDAIAAAASGQDSSRNVPGGLAGPHGAAAAAAGEPGQARPAGTKRYFSELTALEYFIVRHVAVLSMEPLLEGHFNQEELLDLIETKRPTFWSKFGKAFAPKTDRRDKEKTARGTKPGGGGGGGGERGGTSQTGRPIFGIPLEELLERDFEESTDGVGPGSLKVPSLVQEAVSAMKTMDMSVEGVFRKNGNIKRLNDVKEEIDSKGAVEVDLTRENPVQVAALLKKFLRELPDPLLTHKLHKLWITSQRIEDSERRRRVLHLTCCLLPKAHRDTMEILFTFLNWVSSFSHVDEESGSKMDIHNLATVITPNVLHRGKENVPVDDSFLAIEAVHSLIECNESMCEVPEDLALILNDSTLFSNNAEITTKEILRRYGDRAKAPTVNAVHPPPPTRGAVAGGGPSTNTPTGAVTHYGTQQHHYGSNTTPNNNHSSSSDPANPSRPVATRVDTDPYMQNAWQNESSVRHVQSDYQQQQQRDGGGSGGGGVGGGNGQQQATTSSSSPGKFAPYAQQRQGRGSEEGQRRGAGGGQQQQQQQSGSPSRGGAGIRAGNYDKQRAMGVA
ncbi:GTPase-activating protein-like protein of the rho/rac family [Hortaea werneckii]|nr:GTPase-activating protein-like protein of the rho/rac family [Hortaea werneckii]